MTPSEIKAEMERIWQSPKMAYPTHFTRWRAQKNKKLISARGEKAIAGNPKRAK